MSVAARVSQEMGVKLGNEVCVYVLCKMLGVQGLVFWLD